MSQQEHWALLGLAPTDDRRAVKQAYARALKEIDVDADPAAFVRLREALDAALTWGTTTPYWELDDWEEDGEPAAETEVIPADESDAVSEAFEPDKGWNEQWRPALPAARGDDLDRACAELDQSLFDEQAGDPERIAALGESILSDPELENIDRITAVERWLAEAISASAPRSDPLIDPAIARFGWDKAEQHWRHDYDIEAVLQRGQDLRFLKQCRGRNHVHEAGVNELLGPPRTRLGLIDLHLTRDVANFLKELERNHPSLLNDMNADSMGWWRAYLHGRHLPASFLPTMFEGSVGLTVLAAILFNGSSGDAPLALYVFPVAALVCFATILLVAQIGALARDRAERLRMGETPSHLGAEWNVLASLALPPAVALAPGSTAMTWAATLLGFLLLAGAWWSGKVDPPHFITYSKTRFMPILAALASLAIAMILPGAAVAKLAVPLAAMCWLGYWGFEAVQSRLLTLAGAARLRIYVAVLALAVAAASLVGASISTWPPADSILVLVPVTIVAAHVATSASLVDSRIMEWPLRVCALFFYWSSALFMEGSGARLLLAFCFYALAYAIAHVGFAIREPAASPDRDFA